MKNVSISNVLFGVLGFFLIFSCNRIPKKIADTKTNTSENYYNILSADTTNYDKYNIDFDNDGLLDEIFCNKHLLGDSLFIFKNTNQGFKLKLKTINFSEDGLYIIKNIKKSDSNNENLLISTYFNGSGGMEQDIYINYDMNSKKWKIDYTIFKTTFVDENDNLFNKTCKVIQNITLDDNTNWSKYKNIENSNRKDCLIEDVQK